MNHTSYQYTNLFWELRGLLTNGMKDAIVPQNSSSAVRYIQMSQQSHTIRRQFKKSLVVTDNIYTLHLLAKQLSISTDVETKMLGAGRMNNVDGINRPHLKQAIEKVNKSTRCSWLLCQTYEKDGTYDGVVHIAVRSGYIVFKDRNACVFHTNDLLGETKHFISELNKHSIKCLHVLFPLLRWTGIENLHRTELHFSAAIVAYNHFMNGVDLFDQFR